jgi:hypothetical protein
MLGGRSVGIVRLRTKGHGVCLFVMLGGALVSYLGVPSSIACCLLGFVVDGVALGPLISLVSAASYHSTNYTAFINRHIIEPICSRDKQLEKYYAKML